MGAALGSDHRTAYRGMNPVLLEMMLLDKLQSLHCSGGGCEMIRLDAHLLEDADEEIGERIVVTAVEGDMLPVLEAIVDVNPLFEGFSVPQIEG